MKIGVVIENLIISKFQLKFKKIESDVIFNYFPNVLQNIMANTYHFYNVKSTNYC